MDYHATWQKWDEFIPYEKYITIDKNQKSAYSLPRRLMTITSYQDLLYKSEKRNDYLRLMLTLVRRWQALPDDVPLTRKQCIEYLDEIISTSGDCQYVVDELRELILRMNFREDELESFAENPPKPLTDIKPILDEEGRIVKEKTYSAMMKRLEELSRESEARNMGFMPIEFDMPQEPASPLRTTEFLTDGWTCDDGTDDGE